MVDSNRRVDVSVTYGARVPVVASPTKKKQSHQREGPCLQRIVFKQSRVHRAERARPETYTLASAVSFTSYAS